MRRSWTSATRARVRIAVGVFVGYAHEGSDGVLQFSDLPSEFADLPVMRFDRLHQEFDPLVYRHFGSFSILPRPRGLRESQELWVVGYLEKSLGFCDAFRFAIRYLRKETISSISHATA